MRRLKLAIVIIIACYVVLPLRSSAEEGSTRTSVFNERWLDAVVSIEQIIPSDEIRRVTPEEQEEIKKAGGYKALGTGFLVEMATQRVLLVTARHNIWDDSRIQVREGLGYRFNAEGRPSQVVSNALMQQQGFGPWILSATYDLACRFIGWPSNVRGATIPLHFLLPQQQLQAGAQLLVLGFPLGHRSPEHTVPIARQGIVARSDRGLIIADAFVFPGNSGGPVIYLPVIKVGEPLKSPLINEERLVGVVSSYIPFQETAISPRTGRNRILFEENTGLTNIVPADAIRELLNRPDAIIFERILP